MTWDLLGHEATLRLGCFFFVFLVMAGWELIAPRRDLTTSKGVRWANNLGLTLLNVLILRLFSTAGATGFALLVEERQWGILNLYDLPGWTALVLAVLGLDLAIYLQHLIFHHVPVLWRLHKVHHTDLDYDVTTGARFHPLEIILSLFIKMGVIFFLGAPALAVLLFEILLNAASMFNHGNVLLPKMVDQALRLLIVTPDMHRVHHSVIIKETNSNFGFSLTWWDRLLGTYCSQPAKGHTAMTIGLANYREARNLNLPALLTLPLK